MNDVHKLHLFICWLRCRKTGVLNPGIIRLDWIFTLSWDTEKLDRFSPDSPGHPFFPSLSLIFLCFTLAFGALHAPGGFDLGQKEI